MSAPVEQKLAWPGKIGALRKRLKLSQKQLADALNTTQSNVSKWEHGDYKPSPEMFMGLAELAEGTVDALFFMELGGVPSSFFMQAKNTKGLIPSVSAEKAIREAEERRAAEVLASDLVQDLTDEVRSLPLLRDAAAAGTPRTVEDKAIKEVVALPRNWLPRGGTLFAVPVAGDSMAPILKTGDIVIVDVSQRDPKKLNERMVMARSDDGVTIKWLRKDGQLYLLVPQHTSPSYPVKVMGPDAGIDIVGVVVKWIGEPPSPRK